MKRIVISDFSRGIAEDYTDAPSGTCAICKNFDILRYPRRLQPLRGMTTHTASTGIGNLLVASDGYIYGFGLDGSNGQLYKLAGFAASEDFATTTNGNIGVAPNYNLFVEYTNAANARTFFMGGPTGSNAIKMIDPTGGLSVDEESLTYTNYLGQGFVHPKDKILYIPYDNKIATCNNSTTVNAAQFTVPSQYQIYCLTNFGDYLAIPATGLFGQSVYTSVVYLSNRDTSVTTFDASIPWGAGRLQVLNNLNGALIGISSTQLGAGGGDVQDSASIYIKEYVGGPEPRTIFELKAQHLNGNSSPSVTINPRVNFVKDDRLYFSVNIVPNDGIQSPHYGLWSVGKNKQGEYTVVLERSSTTDFSDTGTLAAAMSGDFLSTVHTAAGTLTKTTNGITSNTTFNSTSLYETTINPDMPATDRVLKKKLMSLAVHYLPLPSGAQVVVKYRVDSNGNSSDWVTVGTDTTTGSVVMERVQAASAQFTDGRNYQFRIESTGGAVITDITYCYEPIKTLI